MHNSGKAPVLVTTVPDDIPLALAEIEQEVRALRPFVDSYTCREEYDASENAILTMLARLHFSSFMVYDPGFRRAREALALMYCRHCDHGEQANLDGVIRATLDQAAAEIARLTEENARIREAAAFKRNFLLDGEHWPAYIAGEWVAVPHEDFTALRIALKGGA